MHLPPYRVTPSFVRRSEQREKCPGTGGGGCRESVDDADDLGASQAAVQLTLTADVIGIVIGQLILGPMSDAWGRRRLLISSTLVCAVASELCALAPSVTLLIIWRFVQGGGGRPLHAQHCGIGADEAAGCGDRPRQHDPAATGPPATTNAMGDAEHSQPRASSVVRSPSCLLPPC